MRVHGALKLSPIKVEFRWRTNMQCRRGRGNAREFNGRNTEVLPASTRAGLRKNIAIFAR